MLRKHNKLIMLLVLVTFMFTIVGSAGAASFSDVTGTSAQTAAIYKLNSLGIIDGYQDGTFGPDKNITRAEFAKIACITAGLKSVASGMGSTASPFSDVATNHWANGWINVAAAQGYVKGDPAGTFRPEAQITQAEAITVLMRILGYNDNLPGNWPSDYIAKAANLGDLDDVTFVADQPATRGIIAILTAAVLDEVTVDYAASDNLFKENTDGTTLLAANFESIATDTDTPSFVYDLDLSEGDRCIEILDPALDPTDKDDAATIATDITKGVFKSLKLTDDCVISGAASILGVANRYVDYVTNKDGDVTYIKVRNDADYKVITGVAPKDVDYVSSSKIKINDKSYDVVTNVGNYSSSPQGVLLTTKEFTPGSDPNAYAVGAGFLGSVAKDADDEYAPYGAWGNVSQLSLDKYLLQLGIQAESVDFILNKDGDVVFMGLNAWPSVTIPVLKEWKAIGIVDSVAKASAKIKLKNEDAGSIDLDEDDATSYIVVKNGVVGTLADVAENDLVYELDKYNTTLIVDMSLTKTGSLDSYSDKSFYNGALDVVDKVTVGGTSYNMVKGGGFLSTDDADTFGAITYLSGAAYVIDSDFDDILGDDVTVWLSPSGSVAAVASTTTGTSGKIYGVVNDTDVKTLVNGKETSAVEVLKADGTLATYAPDEDSEFYNDGWENINDYEDMDLLTDGDLVEISLTSDGYIDRIKDAAIGGFGTPVANVYGDSDNMVIDASADGDKYTAFDADGVVVFNLNKEKATDDYDITNTADFMDKIDGLDVDSALATGDTYYYAKDGVMKYIVINSAGLSSSTNKVAMVTSKEKDATDPYVYLMTTGDPVKYYVKGDASDWTNKAVAVYTTSGDKVEIASDAADWLVENAEISSIKGKIINFADGSYYVDSDTLYFDNTGDEPALADFSDLAAGDTVNIYYDGTGAIAAVEIVD